MSFVRQSKYRHIFGKPKTEQFTNVNISRDSADSNLCAVNPKFLAVALSGAGGGPFVVLPLNKVGRLDTDQPVVNGHTEAVIDLAWSPFNDNVIASSSNDCTVKVWEIPENGPITNINEPYVTLSGHERRVNMVLWHPTAENILVSTGSSGKLMIWHVERGELIGQMDFPSFVTGMSFNYDGSLLCATLKDRRLLVIDPHKQVVLRETRFCEGSKAGKCVFLKDGKIFTTGFARMSARCYALWDSNDLAKPLVTEEIDNQNGVLYPFYDESNNVVFTAGKGDSDIKYYEITDKPPYVYDLSAYKTKTSQRGVAFMPKRGCDVLEKEIARFYRLVQSDRSCEAVGMIVPRKSELFQEDIFPDCPCDEPALTADEWIAGKDAPPKLMSWKKVFDVCKDKKKGGQSAAVTSSKPQRSLSKLPSSRPQMKDRDQADHNGTQLPDGINLEEMIDDIKKLKATVRKQNRRIAKLEKIVGDAVADEDCKDDGEEEEE